ncbi:hypothetical protein Hanom_Chr03g00192171 [Helianthus anomalus]
MFRPLSFLFPLNPSRQLHRILCSSLLICPLNSKMKMKMSINLDVNSMASRHVSFLNLFIFLNLISFVLNLISGRL